VTEVGTASNWRSGKVSWDRVLSSASADMLEAQSEQMSRYVPPVAATASAYPIPSCADPPTCRDPLTMKTGLVRRGARDG
jgi:hypothetical protein